MESPGRPRAAVNTVMLCEPERAENRQEERVDYLERIFYTREVWQKFVESKLRPAGALDISPGGVTFVSEDVMAPGTRIEVAFLNKAILLAGMVVSCRRWDAFTRCSKPRTHPRCPECKLSTWPPVQVVESMENLGLFMFRIGVNFLEPAGDVVDVILRFAQAAEKPLGIYSDKPLI